MSEYEVLVEERGNHRALLVPEIGSVSPDWDGQSYVIAFNRRGYCDLMHADYSHHAGGVLIEDALGHALSDTGNDWGVAERYLRVFFDVISFDRISTYEAEYVAVTTRKLAESWGLDLSMARGMDIAEESATSTLNDWQAWLEGDVWIVSIEQRERWERVFPPEESGQVREEWSPIDSCGGYYTEAVAKEEALRLLNHYEPTEAA